MSKKLDIKLFTQHLQTEYPLDQILEFVEKNNLDEDIAIRNWSNAMPCDYCGFGSLEYYRNEEVYYSENDGFSLEEKEGYECIDFGISRCPKCKKWETYID
ncbi:putative RNA-binding Zn-ribbon protein involved in translation (DUF1610 family) [Acetoanaerobium pronyense]|uniref:RNA-binding Zn-ribbon protein involved in translation (DUF1610 family) n=1 Tax=Acetoanaerobium pronyense TaxID=1482736 RepID=A0ABS4KJN9_9FIRM|nr:hypothetical protein [Acetoanaerobium pronyense]MBP2027426.1 putative RNA-binding Zn-ribbon protein involved in translation (DUF1610 family) [Acetoanaerobium pronyense]